LNEWILIGVDKATPWRQQQPDLGKLAGKGHLAPRQTEERRSAWAHSPLNYPLHPHALLHAAGSITTRVPGASSLAQWVLRRVPSLVSRQLQALCVMLHKARSNRSSPDLVSFVSINRKTLEAGDVVDVPDSHIISAYDSTHRELTYSTPEARKAAAAKLIAGKHRAHKVFEYTFDELRPLLSRVHRAQLLKPEFVATAEQLLRETAG
jgi:hypothetical protein